MHKTAFKSAVAFLVAAVLATGTAWADKPEWAGSDKRPKQHKNKKSDRDERRDQHSDRDRSDRHASAGGHFADRQRVVVHEYYDQRMRTGKCPPGLAKKNNGCKPPGQAKKWHIGRPLPPDVVYYELPRTVVVKLGPPPPQHRYVRVAADILLIALGTGMVVDAIQDLGRM